MPFPVVSNPLAENPTPQGVTLKATTNVGDGTLYKVVDQSSTPPSVAQIQAAKGSDGLSVDAYYFSIINNDTQWTNNVTRILEPNTTYYYYAQNRDTWGNDSLVTDGVAFTTPDAVRREAAATPFGGNLSNSASVDVGTNGNRFLVVGISTSTTPAGLLPTTVTYDGVAMTLIHDRVDAFGNQHTVYGIVNPTAGSNTLLVEYTGSPAYMEGPVITALPFYNVKQDSVAAAVRDSGDTTVAGPGVANISLTGVISTDMTHGSAYNWSNTSTGLSFSTLTERSDATFTSNPAQGSGYCEGAAATENGVSTVTITWGAGGPGIALALIYEAYIAPVTATGGGGYHFWIAYEQEQLRKEEAQKIRRQEKEKAQRIKVRLDRELALAERKLEEQTERQAELTRLTNLVRQHRGLELLDERVDAIAQAAIDQQTYSAMERMERELLKMRQEEEFLLMAARLILDRL